MTSKNIRNRILTLLFVGWTLGNFDRYMMNYAVLFITKDLHLSASATGLLFSSFFAGYALMQIPGGWLSDRFGPRKVLLTAIFLWSIFTGLTGAAWSLFSLIIIRFLFGIGEGGFQPASSKLISITYPEAERARAMSIILSSTGIIACIIPISSVAVLTTIGWRAMFVVLGVVGIIITVLYWHFIKLPESNREETDIQIALSKKNGIVCYLFKKPIMWNLLIASFSIYIVQWGLATWLPTYFVKTQNVDLISLGWLQIIPGIATILSIYLSGYIIDKLPISKVRFAGGLACLGVGISLYLMFTASSMVAFITYQTVSNLFIAFVLVLLPVILLKQFPSSVVGTAMGISNTGGQLAGLISPMAIGVIVDTFNGSFNVAFWMLIGFSVVCAGAILTMKKYNVDK
ncbi:MFS transporter [Bacillus pseudomycoides]|uniref:MFS transporter n=1 Tax=Bacillus bingmayongensis TaxID=1150157 RepID=A0ABU5K3W4_9BACI|nr:MFS transporter [Bacillus pseudomycoides]